MNLTELRTATKRFAERSKQATGKPTAGNLAEAKRLFELRSHLSNMVSSNIKVRYAAEPNWDEWSSIAEFFDAYYAAIVDLQNKMAIPLAEIRLEGI